MTLLPDPLRGPGKFGAAHRSPRGRHGGKLKKLANSRTLVFHKVLFPNDEGHTRA